MDGDDVSAEFLIEQSKSQQAPAPAPAPAAPLAIAPALTPECYDGNVEYKLKLVDPTPERIVHLVTQMKWRLNEGNGEAIYEIGVEDGGVPAGLSDEELAMSLATLRRMAEELHADVTVLRERQGISGKVAEVLVRQYNKEEFLEIRIAVTGNVDAGKSTLLGVLTHGVLDNGRGLARLHVFRHKHEIESGRTSSISHEMLGFNSKGEITNYGPGAASTDGGVPASDVAATSAKVVNFIDLAGHEKYLRTTLFGMTGHQPDFCMLIIGSNMGVIGMTKEHLGIALALRVPVFMIVTKIDMCPENILKETLAQIKKILKSPGCRKIPIVVRTEDDVVVCARNFITERLAPIFCVSSVTGKNLDLLRKFINLLPSSKNWEKLVEEPLQFDIDSDWLVPGVGTVVSGTVVKGVLNLVDPVLLGPDSAGNFIPVSLKSVHTKRTPVKHAHAGQSASVALRKVQRKDIRKGMVLISPAANPVACVEFDAEILVLYHATTISLHYEAVVHSECVKQTARVISMDRDILRTGDKARVTFKFMYWPEFMTSGSRLIFREGRAKGIGRVLSIKPYEGGLIDRSRKGRAAAAASAAAASTSAAASTPAAAGAGQQQQQQQQQRRGNRRMRRPPPPPGVTVQAQPQVGVAPPPLGGGPAVSIRHSSSAVPQAAAGAAGAAPQLDMRRSSGDVPKVPPKGEMRRSGDGLKIVRPSQQPGGSNSSSGGSSRAVSPPIQIPASASASASAAHSGSPTTAGASPPKLSAPLQLQRPTSAQKGTTVTATPSMAAAPTTTTTTTTAAAAATASSTTTAKVQQQQR